MNVIASHLKVLKQRDKVKQLLPLLANDKAYLGFSKVMNHTKLVSEFNTILKSIKEDGSYQKIIDSYLK